MKKVQNTLEKAIVERRKEGLYSRSKSWGGTKSRRDERRSMKSDLRASYTPNI